MQVNSYRPLPTVRYAASSTVMPASEPMPLPKPVQPVPTPGGGLKEVASDFVAGVKYGTQRMVEFIKHPFDASKREGPWRNPCDPESTAERIGRAVPGAIVAIGGLLLARGAFKGGFRFGGGPYVGFR